MPSHLVFWRKHFLTTSALALTLTAVAGCQNQKGSQTQTGASAKDTVVIALKRDPTTLDPALNGDATAEVLAKIYDGLVTFDRQLQPASGLAKSWSVSPDGKTYTFELRQGVTFHEGQKLDAGDVAYSLDRLRDKKVASPFMGWYEAVASVKAKGNHTVVITLGKPFAPFLGLLAMSGAYVLDKDWATEEGRNLNLQTNGTGPFSLVAWKKGLQVSLKANPGYFAGAPKAGGLLYRVMTEERAAEAEFLKGKVHLLPYTYLSDLAINRLSRSPGKGVVALNAEGLNVFYLGMNTQKPPFDDARVRQAMNLGLNRTLINQQVFGGRNRLASGPVPTSLKGHEKSLKVYPHDAKAAKALLAQAGHGGGLSTELWHKADKAQAELAEVIAAELETAGVKVALRPLESSAFKEKVIAGEAPLFLMNWQADYPDAENFLAPLFHSRNIGPGGNRARLKDAQVDQLIDTAQITTHDEKRFALYRQLDQRLHDLAPWVFLWHQPVTLFHRTNLGGVFASPLYHADKGNTYQLK